MSVLLEKGTVTNPRMLAKSLARLGKSDATDYRIDVCMDLLGHTSRTRLASNEFSDLNHAVRYAFEKTLATTYTIERDAGTRSDGTDYVYYTLKFQ